MENQIIKIKTAAITGTLKLEKCMSEYRVVFADNSILDFEAKGNIAAEQYADYRSSLRGQQVTQVICLSN